MKPEKADRNMKDCLYNTLENAGCVDNTIYNEM